MIKTNEEFITVYKRARDYVKNGDERAACMVIDDLNLIFDLLQNKYSNDNDAIVQAKCMMLKNNFLDIINEIKANGLSSLKVRAFFGLNINFLSINNGKSEDFNSLKDIVDGVINQGDEKQSNSTKKDTFLQDFDKQNESNGDKNDIDNFIDSIIDCEESNKDKNDDEINNIEGDKSNSKDSTDSDGSKDDFEPQSLDDFIGQEHVVSRIKAEIAAAKKEGNKHIDNILLFGNRGLGKSTLMRLIAKELGVRYEFMDASSLLNDVDSKRRIKAFFQNISEADEPVVIAIDEIHELPKAIQSQLLTLLQSRFFQTMDKSGKNQIFPIKEFTFIGATTDAQKVLSTIKDRCNNLTFYLKDYTRDELKRIFNNKFRHLGLKANEDVIEDCINRCRSSIREVEAFVKGMKTIAINNNIKTIDATIAKEYFDARELDPIGLKSEDIKILNAIKEEKDGIIAADTLAAKVYMDVETLVNEFEPYLIKIGFITVVSKGRSITEKALEYLKAKENNEV